MRLILGGKIQILKLQKCSLDVFKWRRNLSCFILFQTSVLSRFFEDQFTEICENIFQNNATKFNTNTSQSDDKLKSITTINIKFS